MKKQAHTPFRKKQRRLRALARLEAKKNKTELDHTQIETLKERTK